MRIIEQAKPASQARQRRFRLWLLGPLAALMPVLGGTFAQAADVPVPVATDSRIKTFVYSENEVFNIVTHYGYQSNIEFGPQEEIDTISAGDRVPFQIIPAGRRLFIRALIANARTNMTVVTNKHAYQFDIASVPAPVMPNEELVYVVRFYYPDDKKNHTADMPLAMPASSAPVQAAYNYKYTFSGPDAVAPLRIFDDGRSTFFKLRPAVSTPSIFTIDEEGREVPALSHTEGEYTVVNALASRFSIHAGDNVVLIYNEKIARN